MKQMMVLTMCLALMGCGGSSGGPGTHVSSLGADTYLDSVPNHQARVETYLQRGQNISEREKIIFLLDVVNGAESVFLRNGKRYDSDQANRWLRWKLSHPEFHKSLVVTARQFIDYVATRSNRTGKPYQVIMPNGQRYDLAMLLHNELTRLEAAIELSKMNINALANSQQALQGSSGAGLVVATAGISTS